MIKNYLLVALRSMKRNRVFSFINILGLALGIACSLLIMLWVNDERSIDAFHKNGDQLFSVYQRQYYDNKVSAFYSTPGLMADEMKKIFPEVQYASGFAWEDNTTFQAGDKILKEEGNHAGADFFKMFSYPLLLGDPSSALDAPVNIAISRKMADDFFGSPEAAMNKTIRYANAEDLKVTAVFENLPDHASEKFDYLVNWEEFMNDNPWAKEWSNNGEHTFIMLRAGTNPLVFEKKIVHFLDTYNKDEGPGFRQELGIQRFGDIYLHNNFKEGVLTGGRIEYLGLFSLIAVFILLIACINFMNLTTARSVKRAKEIGVRKVVGAIRGSLILQFIGEALLLACMAAGIALFLVTIMLPAFNHLTGKQIELPASNIYFWLSIAALTSVTGIVAGSYPALFLSAFKPVKVLKGTLKFTPQATFFRKGLVVFQFALSVLLIIGTIVISQQLNYIQSTNLGYNRENLVYIPLEGDLVKQYDVFKNEALALPGVKLISRISETPTEIDNGTDGIEWEGKDADSRPSFTYADVGYDFVRTMDLKILEGRDYSKDFATDSVGYLVNEEAAKKIGYDDPIGKSLTFWGKKGTIIGILQDFHFNSLHESIKPLVIRLGEKDRYGNVLVRIEGDKTKQALAGLETLCKQLNPKFTFTYYFSDEEYQKLYKSEQVISKLSRYFAFLAIFISCLGLLGLVIFAAEQRTKEIGIRKVLGASIVSVFTLLSKEFLQLVLIALVIASPLAWFAMNKWLQDFAYRINIQWWVFLFAGIIALLIALLTVSVQALKAAIANPVKSLRTE